VSRSFDPVTDADLEKVFGKEATTGYLPTHPSTHLPTYLPSKVDSKIDNQLPSKSGQTMKYPWLLWTNGEYHDAEPTEFGITLSALQQRLHNRARSSGLILKTETKGLGGRIGFQYFKSTEERDAKWAVEYDDGYGDKGPED